MLNQSFEIYYPSWIVYDLTTAVKFSVKYDSRRWIDLMCQCFDGVEGVREHISAPAPHQVSVSSSCSIRYLLLARAEPWVTLVAPLGEANLRKRENAVKQQLGEKSERCERGSPTAPKLSVGWQEVVPEWSRSFLQPKGGPWWNRLSPCSLQSSHRPDLHVQSQRSPWCRSGSSPEEDAAYEDSPLEQPQARAAAHGTAGGLGSCCPWGLMLE